MKKISRIMATALMVAALTASVAFASNNTNYEKSDTYSLAAKKAAAETAGMQNRLNNLVQEILNTKIGSTR